MPVAAATPRPTGDERSAAYVQLCAPGREKLSVATCTSMKRDLDRAATDEVSAAYRQFCTPGMETLSKATCAAMRVDAGGGAVRSRTATETTAVRVAAPSARQTSAPPTRAAELGDAYAELCAVAQPELSAATCTALRADAAPPPKPKPKAAKSRRK